MIDEEKLAKTGVNGHFYLASETKTVLLLVNNFGKQTLYRDIDENRCIYISLCNIDHDSSDQIVYYMIVEQEPFTIGICRFLIKKRSQVLQIQSYI